MVCLVLGGWAHCSAATFNVEAVIFFDDASGETFNGTIVVEDTPLTSIGATGQRFSITSLTLSHAAASQSWNAAELSPYFIDLLGADAGMGFTYFMELPLPVGYKGGVEPYLYSGLGYEETGGPDVGMVDSSDVRFINRDFIGGFLVNGSSSFAADRAQNSPFPSAPGANVSFTPVPETRASFLLGIGLLVLANRRSRCLRR